MSPILLTALNKVIDLPESKEVSLQYFYKAYSILGKESFTLCLYWYR